MTVHIITGDCIEVMRDLQAGAFQCCVTSPPYYGLRDYGVARQIGLEETAEAYIARLVEVFREVRRLLRKDGTLWLNLGDSYAGSWGAEARRETPARPGWRNSVTNHPKRAARLAAAPAGCKPKDLMLIPERIILALQADGWWIRDRIVWAKPNPMPSSVRDRLCPAWEPVFLLSKSARYFFDFDAAREPRAHGEAQRVKVPGGWDVRAGSHGTVHQQGRTSATYRDTRAGTGVGWGRLDRASPVVKDRGRDRVLAGEGSLDGNRLMRNVWSIATEPFKGAHFATFPTTLAERCVRIGSRIGDAVLDPFGGAGTTGLVADRLGRHATLCELNPDYAALARARLAADAPLLADVTA
jgi:DNA modification methylase